MGTACCAGRSGAVEALAKQTHKQITYVKSELNMLKERQEELPHLAAEENEALRVGEVVLVDFNGRGREGEIEEEVEPGVFRVRWAGANPKYAPPENIPKERLQSVAPPSDGRAAAFALECNRIFGREMQDIWEEYVGDAGIMTRTISDKIVQGYCRSLQLYIHDIWLATGGKCLEGAEFSRLQSAMVHALERTLHELEQQSADLGGRLWQNLPAKQAIGRELFLDRYYSCLVNVVSVRRICGVALAKAMTNQRLSELLQMRQLLASRRISPVLL